VGSGGGWAGGGVGLWLAGRQRPCPQYNRSRQIEPVAHTRAAAAQGASAAAPLRCRPPADLPPVRTLRAARAQPALRHMSSWGGRDFGGIFLG
jgi:hypothetical protein